MTYEHPPMDAPVQAAPEGASPPTPVAPAPAPERRRSRRDVVVLALRALGWTAAASGVLALAALSAYLWVTHTQWTDQNEKLRAEATALGTDLAEASAQASSAQAELETTAAQLDEAKTTISTLANDDATAIDDLQYLEDLTTSVVECADERAELIGYLKQSSRYTASSLRNAENEIDRYCGEIIDLWDEYQADDS